MLVSVCIPTYNGKQFLRDAVESVLRQTYSSIEILIGDDCSDDGTFDLAQDLAGAHGPKITAWRNDERAGLFANYNKCIERARGELIKPFAQDDSLTPDAIAKMVEPLMSDPRVHVVCSDRTASSDLYSAPGDSVVEKRLPAGRVEGRAAIHECLRSYRNLIGEPAAVLCRASALKAMKFDMSYHSLGDLDCWFRLLAGGDLFVIHEPLVTFRQHEGSATMKMLRNMDWVLDFYKLAKVYEKELSAIGITRDEFCMGFTERAGTLIDKMVAAGDLRMDDLDGFREVAFYSMRRCAQLGFKSREYDSVVSSTSWKITEPLRSFMRLIGNSK